MEVNISGVRTSTVFEDLEQGACFMKVNEESQLFVKVEYFHGVNAIALPEGYGHYLSNNVVVIEYDTVLNAVRVTE